MRSDQPESASNPLVSVIVLSYNHERFILETLEGVKAQTYKHTQFILLDDYSSDNSVPLIERWLEENRIECTFIRHARNQGTCKSLNEALGVATGKYVSMVASDDVWLPDKISGQVEIMEAQPATVGVLYSDALHVDEFGHCLPEDLIPSCYNLPEKPQGQVLDLLLEFNFIPGPTVLIRRSCYDNVGLYDDRLPWEDWDMWMRIARHYSFIYSPTPSAKYRVHGRSYSHSDPVRMLKDSFRVCLNQFRIGRLTERQRATLNATVWRFARLVYQHNDKEASDILLALWQVTGSRRARWMYRFARLGVSFRFWEMAEDCALRFQHVRRTHS